MKYLALSILLVLFCPLTFANKFVGAWEVTKVDYPENYFGEIKYPKYFQLTVVNGNLSGSYKDQYDFECKFPLSTVINDGHELLLLTCGTTKHSTSWSPLHKIKLIDGKLVGSVITNTQRFIWYAEPAK
mgnify:CR=1 FL=1